MGRVISAQLQDDDLTYATTTYPHSAAFAGGAAVPCGKFWYGGDGKRWGILFCALLLGFLSQPTYTYKREREKGGGLDSEASGWFTL